LVNLLIRSQSDLHKLYYTNHKTTKAILAHQICMGYGRHCSTLQARTNLYSTQNFLIGICKHFSLWHFYETRIIIPFLRNITEAGKLRVKRVSPRGHPAPSGTLPTAQHCTLPYMQDNCHYYGIILLRVLLHFNKVSASPLITPQWKSPIF